VPDEPPPVGTLAVGDWLVSAAQADVWRNRLVEAVRAEADGVAPAAVARLLRLPDPALLDRLVADPVRRRAGRLVMDADLPARLRRALDLVRDDLAEFPFQAPGADRLAELGIDRADLLRLGRAGELLVIGDGIALLPGSDDVAVGRLAALVQPFTTSEARQALHSSRRVVLPLLAHLDRAGRTVRLPDDTRRVR
jgi:selenocysteine-specific elongation factor